MIGMRYFIEVIKILKCRPKWITGGLDPTDLGSKRVRMAVGARGPQLPKRRVIERLTRKGGECVAEMMGVLTCFKETGFNEGRCSAQLRLLSECVGRKTEVRNKRKSTIFYHLKRLYYMQRR